MPKKNKHLVLKAGLGVAAATAAAGAYYFFGKDGAKHRQASQVWVTKAKKELQVEVKKLKEVNQKTYNAVATKVMSKYEKLKKENPQAYALLTKEVKIYWPKIAKHLPKPLKKALKRKASR